ncbi:PASTA domain protein [Candidatus Koribacter versatilis Ellin345]|uniref:PASTA domain protein n=1 Tax=Koribacter versatilis (strain Ellin345) TaxID=204669 RepID=Q1IIS0_KORVE|nr:PASTA domain-containing protein [Candidatus Koribacter versatilis]ABF43230.1 PASTA domain protein [Candidatus Koribacter versatilis Ellin345]
MRKFFSFVLRLLVLVVVFLVSMLTAMRFAIHTREVPIPKLVGMTPQQAQQTLTGLGLTLVRENRYFSADVPEGKILSQMPPVGEKVRRGWRVRVAESMGPQRAIIPALLGDSQRAAELNIRRRGLDLGTVAFINLPDSEPETVVAQDPPPNATGVTSPKISLLVAAPATPEAFVMPDFVGQPLDSVVKTINDAGFKVGNIHTITPATPTATVAAPAPTPVPMSRSVATVVRQSPSPGQRITTDVAINVDVTR